MSETKTYATATTHSLAYYEDVLLIFIEGLNMGQSHAVIATKLNSKGVPTPTGRDWTQEIVKQSLKRIRLHNEYKSKWYSAMLELCYQSKLTVQATKVLLSYKTSAITL